MSAYDCACLTSDPRECAAMRYGFDEMHEFCDCVCHQWGDDDDGTPSTQAQEGADRG